MHFGLGGFGMILFWVAIVAGIVLLMKVLSADPNPNGNPRSESPLDILKYRYASGEISLDEFEQKKRELAKR